MSSQAANAISIRAELRRLRRISDHLAEGKPLTAEDCAHLATKLRAFLSPDAPASLDEVLGLRCHGGTSVRQVRLNEERDALLRHVHAACDAWCELPPVVAAKKICAAYRRYEAGAWRRDRNGVSAPVEEPAATFWQLLRHDMRIPQEKRLGQILDPEIQDPV